MILGLKRTIAKYWLAPRQEGGIDERIARSPELHLVYIRNACHWRADSIQRCCELTGNMAPISTDALNDTVDLVCLRCAGEPLSAPPIHRGTVVGPGEIEFPLAHERHNGFS